MKSSFLKQIIQNKKDEITMLKKKMPLEKLRKKSALRRPGKFIFLNALRGKVLENKNTVAVIAEIKKKSPSKGLLRKNFKPVELAKAFERSGAAALSVLTDKKFFGGSLAVLKRVRKNTRLPILRKDFILDPCQVYESFLAGADAILLIATILSAEQLKKLSTLAESLGLDALFEVHSLEDVKKILPLRPKLVGINNRDLKSFKVDLKITESLSKHFSSEVFLVSESGIETPAQWKCLKKYGVRGILVGESLMKKTDAGHALKTLLGETGASS